MNAQPLVIGHRGASGHRPEHTAAAYRAAYRMGADSVEVDVLLTRDGVPVCRHDLDLARTTDVADRPGFAVRAQPAWRKGREVREWPVHELTLAEVRALRCRERWPRMRPRSAAFDGAFAPVTLDDVLALRAGEQDVHGRPLAVHIELKHANTLRARGMRPEEAVVEVLRARGVAHRGSGVSLMAFEKSVVKRLAELCDVPRVLLRRGPVSRRRLDRIADFADAVAMPKDLLLPWLPGGPRSPARTLGHAHDLGLGVLVWSLRNENRFLPAQLRSADGSRAHGDAAAEVGLLVEAGVDGLITDFPDVAVAELARGVMATAG